jgi:hypothetical protein
MIILRDMMTWENYWVERKVFAFSKRWRKHKLPRRFYKAGIENFVTRWETVIASNGNYITHQYCKYIKKMIDFSFEKRKKCPFNPIYVDGKMLDYGTQIMCWWTGLKWQRPI